MTKKSNKFFYMCCLGFVFSNIGYYLPREINRRFNAEHYFTG